PSGRPSRAVVPGAIREAVSCGTARAAPWPQGGVAPQVQPAALRDDAAAGRNARCRGAGPDGAGGCGAVLVGSTGTVETLPDRARGRPLEQRGGACHPALETRRAQLALRRRSEGGPAVG